MKKNTTPLHPSYTAMLTVLALSVCCTISLIYFNTTPASTDLNTISTQLSESELFRHSRFDMLDERLARVHAVLDVLIKAVAGAEVLRKERDEMDIQLGESQEDLLRLIPPSANARHD